MYGIQGRSGGGAQTESQISMGSLRGVRMDDLVAIARSAGLRMDAPNMSLFLEQQLEQMETTILRVVRPDLSAFMHIPMRTGSVNAGARTVAYKQVDSAGKAKFISSKAGDLPRVSVGAKKFTAPARMFGLAYGWDFEELLESMFAGAQLAQEEALAAARAWNEFLNQTAWFGDIDKSLADEDFYGLLNNPQVPNVAGGVPINSTSTAAQILAFLHSFSVTINSTTGGIEKPTRLLLPVPQFLYISTTKVTEEGKTILQIFLQNDPYIREVFPVFELAGAGTDNTDVAVALDPALDKLVMDISLGYTPLAMQQRGMEFVIPVVGKTVRVRTFRPKSILIKRGV